MNKIYELMKELMNLSVGEVLDLNDSLSVNMGPENKAIFIDLLSRDSDIPKPIMSWGIVVSVNTMLSNNRISVIKCVRRARRDLDLYTVKHLTDDVVFKISIPEDAFEIFSNEMAAEGCAVHKE